MWRWTTSLHRSGSESTRRSPSTCTHGRHGVISNDGCGDHSTWLQSRRMREPSQQTLITAVFEAAQRATNELTHLVPDLDRDRTEYALASVLLEEAWVSSR